MGIVVIEAGRLTPHCGLPGAKFGVADDVSLNFTLFFNLEEFSNSNGLCVCVCVCV